MNNDIYIKHQKAISNNMIVEDSIVDSNLCKDLLTKALYSQKADMWNKNTGYGHKEPWPINEWSYEIVPSRTNKWLKNHISEETKKIWENTKDYIKKTYDINPKIHGSHINAASFGQEGMIHTDNDGTDIFIIIFLNDDMHIYHGGEFQTYLSLDGNYKTNHDYKNSVINYSISPKAGRMVMADSRIPHRGLAPTRFYWKTRLTLVFRTVFEDKKDTWKKLKWRNK